MTAILLPILANDALPKFKAAFAPKIADVTRKNLKDRSKAIVKLAKDAAEPLMTAEAKKAGATPDDVMLRILDMVGEQAEAEPPEMDEQPGLQTEANGGQPAGARAKVAEYLKAKGMDEASCKEVMDMMPEDMSEDEETPEQKAEREKKEKEGMKPDPKAGEPATRTAMDSAIKLAKEETRRDTLKTLNDIREAERKVRPLIGDIAIAMDSAADVYALCLKEKGIKIDGVHPSAYPAMVDLLVAQSQHKPSPHLAQDAAIVTDRQAFDKSLGIETRRVRVLA